MRNDEVESKSRLFRLRVQKKPDSARVLLINLEGLVAELRAHADAGGEREHAFNLHADTAKLTAARDALGSVLEAIDLELIGIKRQE